MYLLSLGKLLFNFLESLLSIRKNPSPTSAANKTKLEYTSEGQPSPPLELAVGVELGLDSHSKESKKN